MDTNTIYEIISKELSSAYRNRILWQNEMLLLEEEKSNIEHKLRQLEDFYKTDNGKSDEIRKRLREDFYRANSSSSANWIKVNEKLLDARRKCHKACFRVDHVTTHITLLTAGPILQQPFPQPEEGGGGGGG